MNQPPEKDLFSGNYPDQDRFPLNLPGTWEVIRSVKADMAASGQYLIITGYSSLEYLIEHFGYRNSRSGKVEIVLGHEPAVVFDASRRRPPVNLPDQIERYWLEKGISVLLNGPVLRLIDRIESGEVEVFYKQNLHAKLFIGEGHAMLGSSNFSRPGMEYQDEANVRFGAGEDEAWYHGVKAIAGKYREDATPWSDVFIELLKKLLRDVAWQEALAAAISLIRDGHWVEQNPNRWLAQFRSRLWPTQRQAIAQALYLLEREGSVLVADPTGSGKTRLGAHILEALINRLYTRQLQHRSQYQIICPPLVRDTWLAELQSMNNNTATHPVSHGALSNPTNLSSGPVLERIRKANILVIDEAHNYLNKASARSQSVVINRADHMILFTATPLNRRAEDLLRLVEILGLDNLTNEAYDTYRQLLRQRGRRDDDKIGELREYVQRFMVRRTKKELNEAINRDPGSYTDAFGRQCRYPVHVAETYPTGETPGDVDIAEAIDRELKEVRGILYLARIMAGSWELADTGRQETYLMRRIHMAGALARYNIRNLLRSSGAALTEHILGTQHAVDQYGLGGFKTSDSGNMAGKLTGMAARLPSTNLTVDLPAWLRDRALWKEACEKEAATYERIAGLSAGLSGKREETKARKVAELIEKHGMLLAFDSTLITLEIIKKHLDRLIPENRSMIVSGSTSTTKEKLKRMYSLKADSVSMAALCSDALSEGINLQQASAVILLDMPSVIRVAEQRIGRVDRMDSPHSRITVYWPADSAAFRLRTDKRFFERHQLVEKLIGSNIDLPDDLEADILDHFREETLDVEEVIRTVDQHKDADRSWEGFVDAFTRLRELTDGPDALISEETYRNVSRSLPASGCLTSVVRSGKPFVFMAVRGSGYSAPYWILLKDGIKPRPEQDLNRIITWLRQQLPGCEQAEPDGQSSALLEKAVGWLARHEQELLPRKKAVALEQMDYVTTRWLKMDEHMQDPEKARRIRALDALLRENLRRERPGDRQTYDLYELANRWLDIIQPVFMAWLSPERSRHKYRDIRLQNINRHLVTHMPDLDALDHVLENLPVTEPPDRRVAVAIIGVGRG